MSGNIFIRDIVVIKEDNTLCRVYNINNDYMQLCNYYNEDEMYLNAFKYDDVIKISRKDNPEYFL